MPVFASRGIVFYGSGDEQGQRRHRVFGNSSRYAVSEIRRSLVGVAAVGRDMPAR